MQRETEPGGNLASWSFRKCQPQQRAHLASFRASCILVNIDRNTQKQQSRTPHCAALPARAPGTHLLTLFRYSSVQVYGGVVYMDFAAESYSRIPPVVLPQRFIIEERIKEVEQLKLQQK